MTDEWGEGKSLRTQPGWTGVVIREDGLCRGLHPGGGGTPYVRMIGMIVVFFRVCNRRFSIFRGCSSKILKKDKTGIC